MLVTRMKRLLSAMTGALAMLFANGASAEYGLNLPRGVTPISQEAYNLHMLIFWLCVAIAVVVFGAMFISIIKHRKSKGAVASQFHESTTVEILWTVVPFLILVGMAIPATKALVNMEDTSNSDLSIKVTGYQWKWGYEYIDDDISFISSLSTPHDQIYNLADKGENYLLEVDNPLVVPVNKKVRLLITANDVIHAWWVPQLGMKKDAIPGFINAIWIKVEKEGTYRGQCAELCGKDHGFMPIVVVAKNDADYAQWVSDQKSAADADVAAAGKAWVKADLVARGEKVYKANCAACHQANGEGVPGAFPAIKGSAIATGPAAGHVSIVMNGKSGTAMASFAGQLNDIDIAAVITYQRNSLGNNTGDLVQPSDVKAAR
ncbi:cytochrome c oxidase subunit 2 [Thiogranum longum]|uniref:Cytochrome c oxidase subunit 2 n=1 Tax=Thiogranum longum TaxID=1537524 RepID=A0A4R1HA92_9GAMM|nr:cytochrome c oxidase subunit II [Thiogranum longum]TCK17075.1 cytochrome c oxidase subunit 2 [Thiogranum longum]